MRTVGELATKEILQVEKTPKIGEKTAFNGKFAVECPPFVNVDIDENDFISPVNLSTDLYSRIFSGLLAAYPMYDNVVFNPLLVDSDIDNLAPNATMSLLDGSGNPYTLEVRAQYGRGTTTPPFIATSPSGTAPCSVAILPSNKSGTVPYRDGLLITNTMDITSATSGAGALEFMVYWKIYQFETSEDIRATGGAFSGMNSPALRNIVEIDQEPSDLTVYISLDDGVTWHEVGWLEPIAFCTAGTKIRLAFRNTGDVKYYIASYAIMF